MQRGILVWPSHIRACFMLFAFSSGDLQLASFSFLASPHVLLMCFSVLVLYTIHTFSKTDKRFQLPLPPKIPTRLCGSVWVPRQRGRSLEPSPPSASTTIARGSSAGSPKGRYACLWSHSIRVHRGSLLRAPVQHIVLFAQRRLDLMWAGGAQRADLVLLWTTIEKLRSNGLHIKILGVK